MHPPKWVFFAPPAVLPALIYILAVRKSGPIAYIVYVLAAYCLIICILPLPKLVKRAKDAVMRRALGTDFGKRYVADLAFRGEVAIYRGMTINLLYAAFRAVVGICYGSAWFLTMAVYYAMLGGLRAYLIKCYRRNEPEKELQCYRKTAWMLFLLNVTMGGMILMTIITDSAYSYSGFIIYVSAIYAFYAFIFSIVNIVKFRKLGSPILSAAKVLNLVAALMSVLGLQTAMIARFSPSDEGFRQTMNIITGGVIYGTVIAIGVYMLIHSANLKRRMALEQVGE